MTQPEALRLADELPWLADDDYAVATCKQAAAELRRLHAECEHHKSWVAHITTENEGLRAQRDALLEALRWIAAEFRAHGRQHWPEAVKARAAIAAAEVEKE